MRLSDAKNCRRVSHAASSLLAVALTVGMVTPQWLSPCCGPGADDGAPGACCDACSVAPLSAATDACDDCRSGSAHRSHDHGDDDVPAGCAACVAPCCLKVYPPVPSGPSSDMGGAPPVLSLFVVVDRPDSQIPEGIFRPPRA